MQQQAFLRNDMLEFSNRLSSENYNVKAFRKRNKSQSNKNNKKILLSTQILTSDYREESQIEGVNEAVLRNIDVLSAKRLSLTAGVRKRSHLNESQIKALTKTARTKQNSVIEEPAFFSQKSSTPNPPEDNAKIRFAREQREHFKGSHVKNKHLQNWLNQILQQHCHEQKFDATLENPALKKYAIDKNSLLSKGINPQNLQRIYKSLFVYSMGFNTLLKEIGCKNMNLRKTLWKVFAILLEYCSEGDFQSMIAEIERDKVRKMQQLREQIERRQQVIENNEQINQEKNAKIFKELKLLREENSHLQNDKNVLLQDYKQAEQAFNEEVSLRLRFQNKINEIHGVHRELTIKHQKLHDDLTLRTHENNLYRQKHALLTDQIAVLKAENQFLKQQNKSYQESLAMNSQMFEDARKKCISHDLLQVQWRHKKQQFAIQLRQRQKHLQQVKRQLNNAELMLQMKDKSQQELQKEYRRALKQNSDLVSSLQRELERVNTFMAEKKEFNDAHSKIYAEIDLLNQRLSQRTAEVKLLEADNQSAKAVIVERSQEIETLEVRCRQLDKDIQDLYVKIGEMKKVKTAFQEEVVELKAREDQYLAYHSQKEKVLADLSGRLEQHERTIAEFNLSKKGLESKVALLNQKLQAEEQMSKKKISKLQAQVQYTMIECKKLRVQAEESALAAERANLLYEQTFSKLKDQLFERNDLELRYNQSLSVVQSQTEHIKKLSIKISEMQERHEEMSRKLKAAEFILENKQKSHQNEISQAHASINALKQQIRGNKHHVHPMKFQDTLGQLLRIEQALEHEREKAVQQARKMNVAGLQAKIKRLQGQLLDANIEHQLKLDRQKRQLQEAMQQLAVLRQKKSENQTIQKRTTGDDASHKQGFKQKERKYLEVIKEKNLKVQELLQDLQKSHDTNRTLRIALDEMQSSLYEKVNRIKQLQTDVNKVEAERHQLNLQKAGILREKQKMLAQQFMRQQSRLGEQQPNSKLILELNSQRDLPSQQHSYRQNTSRQSQSRQKGNKPGWRNDFAKKVKNAYTYYHK